MAHRDLPRKLLFHLPKYRLGSLRSGEVNLLDSVLYRGGRFDVDFLVFVRRFVVAFDASVELLSLGL